MLRLLTLALSALLLAAAMRGWEQPGLQADADTPALPPEPVEEQREALLSEAQEEPVLAPDLPAEEEIAALAPEVRVAQASALKAVLLSQMLRLLRDEHRLTPENLRQSADAARVAGAPLYWQRAMLALAGGVLSPRERRELEKSLETFYGLYGVDVLALRLFVETSRLSVNEIAEILPSLPLEPLFNLPAPEAASAQDLAVQAEALKEVFSALQTSLASAHDKDSADAAADALIPFLPLYDRTQKLRLAHPEEQVEAFAAYRDFFPPAAKTIREQRVRLFNAGYFSSPRLRAIDYLLQ